MGSLKSRVARLEAARPPTAEVGSEREQFDHYVCLVLDGFPDVTAWLEGDGPQPDPHRLADMIRGNLDAGFDCVPYAEALRALVRLVAKRRTAEKTGQPVPDDPDEADGWLMANADKVSGSLLRNADLWLEHAEGLADGTIPENTPLIGRLISIPYIEGECGRDCPRWRDSPEAKREYRERLAVIQAELKEAGLIP